MTPTKNIRIPELAIGATIVLTCVIGALAWGGPSQAAGHQVLVASHDLKRGHLFTSADLTTVEISSSSDVALLDASLAEQVVGLRATTSISAGTPLTEGQLDRREKLDVSDGLVGLVVSLDQAPIELAAGDTVDVVAVTHESDGTITRERLPMSMEVWDVAEPDPMTGDRSVTLRIDLASAPDIVGHDEVHLVKAGR